jgi:sodium/potassium/calcium exchanger 6
VGDFVANISVAKSGYVGMAIAGCYAGPVFNLLVGLYISLLMQCLSGGDPVTLNMGPFARLSFFTLVGTLTLTTAVVRKCGGRLPRWFAYGLIGVYLLYTVLNVVMALEGVGEGPK